MNLKDVTVVMITHRINDATLSKADEILVMKDGNIREKGSYRQLLDAKGMLYGYKMIAGTA